MTRVVHIAISCQLGMRNVFTCIWSTTYTYTFTHKIYIEIDYTFCNFTINIQRLSVIYIKEVWQILYVGVTLSNCQMMVRIYMTDRILLLIVFLSQQNCDYVTSFMFLIRLELHDIQTNYFIKLDLIVARGYQTNYSLLCWSHYPGIFLECIYIVFLFRCSL